MIVDCDRCAVRGAGCAGCVMTVLLGAPPGEVPWEPLDESEQRALGVLADNGLVPPLRMVPLRHAVGG